MMNNQQSILIPWECKEAYYSPRDRPDRWLVRTAYEIPSSWDLLSSKADIAHMITEANANLIVTAVNALPDLIEALENYMSAFGQALEVFNIPHSAQQVLADAEARAALAKAKATNA